MTRPRVFVTRIIPEPGLALLRESCETILWTDETPPPYAFLRAEVAQAEGVLCLLSDRIDAELMDEAPELKVISQMAVGYDNIDLHAATARGIPVGHTPGVLTDTTADFAFALLMAAARRLPEAERYARAGHWRTWGPTLFMGQDVTSATLGIVGMGRIGQAVAQRAAGFSMRVLYTDPNDIPEANALGARRVPFEALLAESDFISLHTPLNPTTRHLLGADAFARMKPTCIVINTSRGAVIDPDALYEALESGRIARAALDVTEPEPLPVNHGLYSLENCLIVPHIASSSVTTRGRMAVIAAENLLAGLKGERLPHCANPQIYD